MGPGDVAQWKRKREGKSLPRGKGLSSTGGAVDNSPGDTSRRVDPGEETSLRTLGSHGMTQKPPGAPDRKKEKNLKVLSKYFLLGMAGHTFNPGPGRWISVSSEFQDGQSYKVSNKALSQKNKK